MGRDGGSRDCSWVEFGFQNRIRRFVPGIFLGGGITACREQGTVIPAARGVGSRRLGHFRERLKDEVRPR
jgi:hypothetical protein